VRKYAGHMFAFCIALALGLAVGAAPLYSAWAAPKTPEETTRGATTSEKIPPGQPTYRTYSVRPPNTKLIAPKAKPHVCPDGKRYVWVCEMVCDLRGCRPSRCYPSVECY